MNLRNINDSNIIKTELETLKYNKNLIKDELKLNLQSAINKAQNDYDKLIIEVNRKYDKDKYEIQSRCHHKMIEDGRDSHKTYYTCKICGYEE